MKNSVTTVNIKFKTPPPFEPGDRVVIVKEPVFVTFGPVRLIPNPMAREGASSMDRIQRVKKVDLNHLIGVKATVDAYIPNMFNFFAGMQEGFDPEIGLWILTLDEHPKLGVPRGLLAEGFRKEWIEKIDEPRRVPKKIFPIAPYSDLHAGNYTQEGSTKDDQ